MFKTVEPKLQEELNEIRDAGLYKEERIITTPQSAAIRTTKGEEVLNFCANNYLGLSSHPAVIEAAKAAIDKAVETYGKSERNKYRAVVYYMLTKHFGKESVYK